MDENEKKFWSDMDGIFPELVKQMASLAKKSYYSITNLKSGITWWSESTLEYFGLEQNYTAIGKEKTKRELHPDDVETFNTASDGALKEMTLTSHGNIVLKTETSITASTLCRR